MSRIDLGIICCLIISICYSLFKGMTREIFSLTAIFLGYWAANTYYHHFSFIFSSFIVNSHVSSSLAFFSIFLLVSILVGFAGRIVKKLMKMSKAFSFIDRFGGGLIGLIKALILISLIMIPVNIFPELGRKVIDSSMIAPYFLSSSRLLAKISYDNSSLFEKKRALKMVNRLREVIKDSVGSTDVLDRITDVIRNSRENTPSPKIHIPEKDKKSLDVLLNKIEGR